MIFPQFLEVGLCLQDIFFTVVVCVFVSLLTWIFFSFLFYGLKLLQHLESFRKLKGKLKKGDEPGWSATRGLRSVLYVLLHYCICLLNLISSLFIDSCYNYMKNTLFFSQLDIKFKWKIQVYLFIQNCFTMLWTLSFYSRQKHWLRRISGTYKPKENKLRDM